MIRAPLPWMLRSPAAFAAFRFVVYGTVGLASEIVFLNLTRLARRTPLLSWAFRFEWRVDPALGLDGVWSAPQIALFGQVSLWMFLVYAGCSLLVIEPMYRRLERAPMLVRGAAYAVAILGYEWLTGHALLSLTGVAIWLYADPFAIGGMTSVALLPAWIGTGLFAEGLFRGMAVLAPLVRDASAPAAQPASAPRSPDVEAT